MVGWREQIESTELLPKYQKPGSDTVYDEEDLPNWQNLSNLWIGLFPQSGLATVAENAFADETYEAIQKNPTMESDDKKKDALIESQQIRPAGTVEGGPMMLGDRFQISDFRPSRWPASQPRAARRGVTLLEVLISIGRRGRRPAGRGRHDPVGLTRRKRKPPKPTAPPP